MNCREFVKEKIGNKKYKELQEKFINKDFINKNNIEQNQTLVFFEKGHMGLCRALNNLEVTTKEMSDGKEFERLISIFNDNFFFIKIDIPIDIFI